MEQLLAAGPSESGDTRPACRTCPLELEAVNGSLRHLLPIQPELNMDNRVVYPSPEIYLLNLVTSVCLEGCDCNLPQSLANDISEGYRTTLLVFSLWVSWLTTLILTLIWAHY